MPFYNFECSRCDTIFEKELPMSKATSTRPSCPSCGKRKCTRNYSECVSIMGFDVSPKTLGAVIDRNDSQFSEDRKEHLIKEHNKKLYKKKKEREESMPSGMGTPVDNRGKTPKSKANRIIEKKG